MERPIGLFDSGVGGLTVLSTLKNLLPNENIIYIGDNANCPYGDKTPDQLFVYASRIIEYFIENNVKLIVMACNTTSANVLDKLQEHYPSVKIIGVINATVHDFILRDCNNVVIIATEGTINSNKYGLEIINKKHCNVHSLATPKLVPLIESGTYKNGIYSVLHEYLDKYKGVVDAIILGCTHYPIVQNQIAAVLPNIEYISSSDAVGSDVKRYLEYNKLLNVKSREYIQINTTGNVIDFINSSSGFFDYQDLEVHHLSI